MSIHSYNQEIALIDFDAVFREPHVTPKRARELFAKWSELLNKSIVLDLNDFGTGIRVDSNNMGTIPIPVGLLAKDYITEDGLALLVAHESAHLNGYWNEGDADYWAAAHGLRLLWGNSVFDNVFPKRAFLAAYSLVMKWTQTDDTLFSTVTPLKATCQEKGNGYPTLQGRWNILTNGFLGWEKPLHSNITPSDHAK